MRWVKLRGFTHMRHLCIWALCPCSKKSVGKSTCEFSPHEQISLSIFQHVRNGFAWNYHNASQRTCQTITQRKMTSATTRDAPGMKNDFWLRLAASWFPTSEFPPFFPWNSERSPLGLKQVCGRAIKQLNKAQPCLSLPNTQTPSR